MRTQRKPRKHFSPRLQALEDRTVPNTYTVAVGGDSNLVTNNFRAAIGDANKNPGPDTIIFGSNFDTAQTIKLTNGQLTISGSLTITGPPVGVTISGNSNGRVFNLNGTGTVAVSMSDLTITGGLLSGANQGGGILNTGEDLTLTRCTVSNNTTQSGGGGIAIVGGSLTVLDSTISGNKGSGGGIYFNGAPNANGFTIRNSTISGNLGSGILLGLGFNGTCKVQNSTITANTSGTVGGGIARTQFSTGLISLESTIVSGNTATGVGDDIGNGGTVTANFCAIGDSAGFTLSGSNNLPFGANLMLGPLASNGGPTLTHLSALDSPLIDKGSNPAGLTTDQRGTGSPRVVNTKADIGAVETFDLVVRNTNDAGIGSLRETILDANAISGANTITFDAGFIATAKTITLTSGELSVNDHISIAGPLGGVTISGNLSSRVLNIGPNTATLSNLSITNGKATGPGGGIRSGANSNLQMNNCTISGNSASQSGGGIHSDGGVLSIQSCSITGNTSLGNGGGIYAMDHFDGIFVLDSIISGNTASALTGFGGGICISHLELAVYGHTFLTNNTISENVSAYGGGVALRKIGMINGAGAVMEISNCTISGNSATASGGGILGVGLIPGLDIECSTVTGNIAGSKGGGIFGYAFCEIRSTIVSGNSAITAGPDVYNKSNFWSYNSAVGNAAGFILFDGSNNLPFGIDLKLGPLADNGGPTLTHLPANDSPLINKGKAPLAITNDQRGVGYPRLRGAGIDIGAVEVMVLAVTNSNDAGAGSLRQAIIDSNTFAGADTVIFDPTVFASPQTIKLLAVLPELTDSVSFLGTSAANVTVTRAVGAPAFRMFHCGIAGVGSVAFHNMTITGGLTSGVGVSDGAGILCNNDNVTIAGCVISNNNAMGMGTGGGISVGSGGGAITIVNTTISGNTANRGGGVDFYNTGTLVMDNCTVSGNVAKDHSNGGGGVYSRNNTAVIRNSTFSGNVATAGRGGGLTLYSSAGNVTLQNCTVSANTALLTGGGIHRQAGTLTIESTVAAGNTALGTGDDVQGAITANFSLLGISDDGPVISGANNKTGTSATPLNPLLGSLAANGGPTLTHLPQTGSPLLNAGSNPAALVTDQRGLPRGIGVTDIGSIEDQTPTPNVSGFTVNGGAAQRSRLTTITVTFFASQDVTLFQNPGAVTLTRTAATSTGTVGTVVTIGSGLIVTPGAGNGTAITLTFVNAAIGGVEYGSLADGRWRLAIPSLGYQSPLNDPTLRRLYGDGNADGTVDGNDLAAFGATFGQTLPGSAFDFNNDGTIDALDFGEFGNRFGVTL